MNSPKFQRGDVVLVNIYASLSTQAEWVPAVVKEVATQTDKGFPLSEPMYNTSRGTYAQSAVKPTSEGNAPDG